MNSKQPYNQQRMSRQERKLRSLSHQQRLSPLQIQSRNYCEFELEQAYEMLPMVHKLTRKSARTLTPIQQKLNNMVPADPRIQTIKREYETVVRHWTGKIERLGLSVQGLWRVGFDCGAGWYVWQRPERRIRYFLEYGQRFEEAVLIEPLGHSANTISAKYL